MNCTIAIHSQTKVKNEKRTACTGVTVEGCCLLGGAGGEDGAGMMSCTGVRVLVEDPIIILSPVEEFNDIMMGMNMKYNGWFLQTLLLSYTDVIPSRTLCQISKNSS